MKATLLLTYAFGICLVLGCTRSNSRSAFRGEIYHLRVSFQNMVTLVTETLSSGNQLTNVLTLRDSRITSIAGQRFYSQTMTNYLLDINPDAEIWHLYTSKPTGPESRPFAIALCSPVPFVTNQRATPMYIAYTFQGQPVLLNKLPDWAINQVPLKDAMMVSEKEMKGISVVEL